MNKVFYISADNADVFYVRASNAQAAEKRLLEDVGKYLFKRNLAGKKNPSTPNTIGKNIIVEYAVHKSITTAKLDIEDITAAAFIFSNQGKKYWKEWVITEEDVRENNALRD